MTFAYNQNIPFATNNPSNDQPLMEQNTNSIYSILNVDHYTFGTGPLGDGKHKQIQMPALLATPTVGVLGETTIYPMSVTRGAASSTELFITPDANAANNSYQLTQTILASQTQFGVYNAYTSGVSGVVTTGGWTFLPGGLILQYGTVTPPKNGSFTVNLPIPFATTNMVMTISIHRNSGSGGDNCYINAKGLTSFTYFTSTSGTGFQSFDFMAIGI